jgi:acyl-lipid omega-6 desaturase (Delta-12 desaturase)
LENALVPAGASQLRLRRLLRGERRLARPLVLFLLSATAYGATVATILASGRTIGLLLVPVAGLLICMLFVIGHDACHQSFTSSTRLNELIGRMAFLPALHAFSLWDHEHNRRHHRFNNIRHLDYAWVPMSPDEFARARPIERLKYRFYRDPGGVLFYYLIEIWPRRKLFARRSMLGTIQWVHIADTALVWAFLGFYVAVVALAGAHHGRGILESLLVAFVLPFLIFNMLFSAAIFLHHTHYRVPWYPTIEEWKRARGGVHGTVHVEFPWIFRKLFLHIMEHNAHHRAPGVPLYHLPDLQDAIRREGMVAWQFSLREYFNICARCKLFDYQTQCWLDFDGHATSDSLR